MLSQVNERSWLSPEGTKHVIETYGYSSCTSCKKTDKLLTDEGAEFTSRDYFKVRFTAEELRALLDRAGLQPHDVLSKRSRAYKELELEGREVGPDELIDLMVQEPTLLRRPIILGGGEVIVGHNPKALAEVIARTAG